MKSSSEIRPNWSDKIPEIGIEVLERWFKDENSENREPNLYVHFIDDAIYILLRFWVDADDNDYLNIWVKNAINGILQIKDDFVQLSRNPGVEKLSTEN